MNTKKLKTRTVFNTLITLGVLTLASSVDASQKVCVSTDIQYQSTCQSDGRSTSIPNGRSCETPGSSCQVYESTSWACACSGFDCNGDFVTDGPHQEYYRATFLFTCEAGKWAQGCSQVNEQRIECGEELQECEMGDCGGQTTLWPFPKAKLTRRQIRSAACPASATQQNSQGTSIDKIDLRYGLAGITEQDFLDGVAYSGRAPAKSKAARAAQFHELQVNLDRLFANAQSRIRRVCEESSENSAEEQTTQEYLNGFGHE